MAQLRSGWFVESRQKPRIGLRRVRSPGLRGLIIVIVLAVLFGVPWWTLAVAGAQWPGGITVALTVLFAGGLIALPALLYVGHGRPGRDWAVRSGDLLLGIVWVLFAWAVLGNLLGVALAAGGVADPLRSRIVVAAVVAVALLLMLWGYAEAMRVPRVRKLDVSLKRLGAGLDGLRVVLLSDTHFGPIDRRRWSSRVAAAVNRLDADIVCHLGDIADGSVARRRAQVAPLAEISARLAKVYVPGNHEHFGDAEGWLEHMRELGWQPLRNRHVVVRCGGAALVVAGVDDASAVTAADYAVAFDDIDAEQPVLLLAHQPSQIDRAVARGVDLQLSGHTHGGQMWPFHMLVRLAQPSLQGLSRHGRHTQLYTSRGTGFWGPPMRIFAPSEITVLVLRCENPSP